MFKKRHLYGDGTIRNIPVGNNNLKRLFVLSQVSRQPTGHYIYRSPSPCLMVLKWQHWHLCTGPNKCKDHSCQHMCVIHNSEALCICADGFPAGLQNGTACAEEHSILEDYDEHGDKPSRPQQPHASDDAPMVTRVQTPSSRQNGGAVTGLAVTFVSFVLMFTVYFYLRKKKPGLFKRRDLRWDTRTISLYSDFHLIKYNYRNSFIYFNVIALACYTKWTFVDLQSNEYNVK